MCSCHSILECCVMFSGVKLSIRSFVLFLYRYIDDLISFNNKRFKEFLLIFTPKNSQFLKPQNILQLFPILIYFLSEIKATI